MKRIVVLSDMQIPYQDKRATRAVMNFVADYEPDELFCVGDEADSPEPSRWNKGLAGEFVGTLQKGLDETTKIMTGFKEALGDKPFHTMRSNHGDRIHNYVNRFAPALSSLRDLEYSKLLRYRENEITYHNKFYQFTPGWILAHGDEGRANKQPGGTALTLAKQIGASVVCGHTHKQGIQHEHTGFGGSIKSRLYGVEVGHLMDLSQAHYLGQTGANWQQGFTILYSRRGNVTPVNVPINGRSFVVEGKVYEF